MRRARKGMVVGSETLREGGRPNGEGRKGTEVVVGIKRWRPAHASPKRPSSARCFRSHLVPRVHVDSRPPSSSPASQSTYTRSPAYLDAILSERRVQSFKNASNSQIELR